MTKRAAYVWTLAVLLIIIPGLIVRFANPDMTETRLLIEFWWLWLADLGVLLVILHGVLFVDKDRR